MIVSPCYAAVSTGVLAFWVKVPMVWRRACNLKGFEKTLDVEALAFQVNQGRGDAGRHADNGERGLPLVQGVNERGAVHGRHLHVGDHQITGGVVEARQAFLAVPGGDDGIPLGLERVSQQSKVLVIINEQNACYGDAPGKGDMEKCPDGLGVVRVW